MKAELEEELFKKYPKIFADRNNAHTCMQFGLSCGDGWYNLIDTLCMNIQNYLNYNKVVPYVVAQQIKEKFGSLRFYTIGGDDYTSGLITMAESMSERTCETCGDVGTSRNNGWIRTQCDKHAT